MKLLSRSAYVLAAATAAFAAGCHNAPVNQASAGPVRHYPLHGTVVGMNSESGEVEVNAAAIPGFMDAMTMPYPLKDPAVLKTLHRGDQITGTLDVTGDATLLEDVKVTSRAGETQEPTPQALMKPLTPGEAVPDFALTNQNDTTIHLAEFKGKALLLTFVYTHCPLADYCPRMSHYFASVDETLQKQPALYAKTHLLTVTFDPKRDTPAVLRSYGGAYTGRYTNETFTHWSFAAPEPDDAAALYKFFDVSSVPAPGGTLTHTLSTVVIAPDGRIAQWFTGTDWTPQQALAALQQAAGAKA